MVRESFLNILLTWVQMGTEKTDMDMFKEKVAPPKGFEPLTNWLTARRSTGLSHGGKA